MPTVASKQTQAGAEAFVRHWIASLDHVYQGSGPDLVMELSGPECLSCPALVDGIPGNPGRERTFEVLGVSGLLFGDELARVEAEVEVLRGDGTGVGVLVFDLSAGSGGWVVDSIRLQERP